MVIDAAYQFCFQYLPSLIGFPFSGGYSWSCDRSNECKEEYQDCKTNITDPDLIVEKAPGIAAKVRGIIKHISC